MLRQRMKYNDECALVCSRPQLTLRRPRFASDRVFFKDTAIFLSFSEIFRVSQNLEILLDIQVKQFSSDCHSSMDFEAEIPRKSAPSTGSMTQSC